MPEKKNPIEYTSTSHENRYLKPVSSRHSRLHKSVKQVFAELMNFCDPSPRCRSLLVPVMDSDLEGPTLSGIPRLRHK